MSAPSAAANDLKQRLGEAISHHTQGRFDDAVAAYQSLLQDYPNQPELLHALGVLYMQCQQWDAAAQQLVTLLTIVPDHGEAIKLLFEICRMQSAHAVLTEHPIHAWIKANPNLVALRSVAASLCQLLGEHEQRLSHLKAVQRMGNNSENLYAEITKALRDNAQFDAALEQCQQGLGLYKDSLPLLKLRGELYLSLSQYDKALKDGTEVLARTPDDHYARTTLGSIKLLMSDCREGYEDYAVHADFALAANNLTIGLPRWQGEKLAGKKLLLWSSQGIGDIIMFASLLPWVLSQGAEVTLATYKKIIPLFARSFPQLTIIEDRPQLIAQAASICDFHAVLGELMRYGLPHYTPATHPPYLNADPKRVQQLRSTYQAQAQGKKLVGISWSTTNSQTFSQRNIPLEAWQSLFTLPNVQCVSLQYGNHKPDIDAINRKIPGALLNDPTIDAYGDTDALAAQICAMDEIVSIQNSTVHLAGALGVKTTLLLSAASDWRWGLGRTDSHWYKSVTIDRQEKLFDWSASLARVSEFMSSL